MTKIFISHSSEDNEFAQQLAEALTNVGIEVWIDLTSIRAGKKWSTEIYNALDQCDAMILIISPDAMKSVNVEDEWQYFFDKYKRENFFIVRWKPTDVHFQLKRVQYVDFHEKVFAEAFEKLSAELKRIGANVSGFKGQSHNLRADIKSVFDEPGFMPMPSALRDRHGKQAVISIRDILPPPMEWVEIPFGQAILEGDVVYTDQASQIDLPSFAITKYPITNAQYQVFLEEADGYNNKSWWDFSDQGRKWSLENYDVPHKSDSKIARLSVDRKRYDKEHVQSRIQSEGCPRGAAGRQDTESSGRSA